MLASLPLPSIYLQLPKKIKISLGSLQFLHMKSDKEHFFNELAVAIKTASAPTLHVVSHIPLFNTLVTSSLSFCPMNERSTVSGSESLPLSSSIIVHLSLHLQVSYRTPLHPVYRLAAGQQVW